MTLDETFKIASAVLAALGGGALIVGAFAHFLGNLWANRLIETKKKELEKDLELYKSKLKRIDFIFQKEFEAASEFVALNRKLSPSHNQPNMDWTDACEQIARNFHLIEKELGRYTAIHGAVLNESARSDIFRCISIAGENRFNLDEHDISEDISKSAGDLLTLIDGIERNLISQFSSQSKL